LRTRPDGGDAISSRRPGVSAVSRDRAYRALASRRIQLALERLEVRHFPEDEELLEALPMLHAVGEDE
jgi:hypothetical protein